MRVKRTPCARAQRMLGERDAVDAHDALRSRQLELERDLRVRHVGLEHLVEQHAAAREIHRAADVRLAVDVLVEQDVDRHAPLASVVVEAHEAASIGVSYLHVG